MILTYLGNPKYLSNKEIKELINNPLINGINRNELIAILNTRIKWNTEAKDILAEKVREYENLGIDL